MQGSVTLYEHHRGHLLPRPAFLRRAARHLLLGMAILGAAVGLGTLGYHRFGELEWIDAFLNASMILSGMGPVDHLSTSTAKLFASLYALFSGLVFIGVAGVVVAPWVHRLFHWMKLEE